MPSFVDPDPGAALDADAVDPVVGEDGDDDGLEALHVVADPGRVLQLDDGVAHQLPGAVPGEFAAAVHGDDGGSVKGPFVVFGAFTGRIDGGMFEQQYGAGRGSGEDFLVKFALDFPAARVFDEFRGKTQL